MWLAECFLLYTGAGLLQDLAQLEMQVSTNPLIEDIFMAIAYLMADTKVRIQYQQVFPIPMEPCSTTLKLAAMEWLAHLTTYRKNSPVQFVPSKELQLR